MDAHAAPDVDSGAALKGFFSTLRALARDDIILAYHDRCARAECSAKVFKPGSHYYSAYRRYLINRLPSIFRSDGGLLATVAEMCFASHCGVSMTTPTDDKAEALAFWFNEELVCETARAIVVALKGGVELDSS